MTAPDPDQHRIKHLDMLQGVVTRLSQHSFTVRGWSVTLVSVVFALITAQNNKSPDLILIALAPAWIFWGLDAYYLNQERRFRKLFETAAARTLDPQAQPDIAPYDMRPPVLPNAWRVVVTPNVLAVPAMLTALVVGYWVTHR